MQNVKTENQLKYEKAYAWVPGESMIVRLVGGGLAIVRCDEKKDGLGIEVSDYAMTFLKFDPYCHLKKVENEDDVPLKERETARYNLEHCSAVYGRIQHVDTNGINPW